MTPHTDIAGAAHPAPHRGRASAQALAYALAGAPAAWFLHLLVNYGLASQACRAGAAPPSWSTIVIVDLVALAVAAGVGFVAYGLFHRTRAEKEGNARELVETGEGRTRFLAICGLLASALFALAIVADLAGPFMELPCA